MDIAQLEARYNRRLLSLDQQRELLLGSRPWAQRNSMYGYQISPETYEVIRELDTASSHRQRLTDLEVLHVEGSCPGQTIHHSWNLLAPWAPRGVAHWNALSISPQSIGVHPAAQEYRPGVYIVRVNLLGYCAFSGQHDDALSSMLDVQEDAQERGVKLAGGEALAALAYHRHLIFDDYGLDQGLPYVFIGAYLTGNYEHDRHSVPQVSCERADQIGLRMRGLEGYLYRPYAVPTLVTDE